MSASATQRLCSTPAAPVKPLPLRLNCSWIATGHAVAMAAQWVRVVLLLHLGGEAMVGSLALAFAVCTPVYALAQLDLRGVAATDARREYQFGDYFALRLAASVAALLVVAAVVLATGYEAETAVLILLIGAAETFKAIGDICHAPAQQNERMDRLAISMILRSVLMVAVLGLAVWWTGSLLCGAVGLLLTSGTMLLAYDLPSASRTIRALSAAAPKSPHGAIQPHGGLKPRWHPHTMLRLAWLALPMGIVVMIIALQMSVPRYVVDYYLGRRALGVFVSIFCLGMIGAKVAAALAQSSGPRLAKYYAEADVAAFCRLLGKLVGLVVGLGVATVLGMLLLGRPLLALIYSAELARYAQPAVYLMLAAAVGYLTHPLGIALIAMRRLRTHLVVRGVAIAVLTGVSPVLVPAYGLGGIAAAILISSTCAVLGCLGGVAWGVQCRRRSKSADLPCCGSLGQAA